jgi:hypothetical protein
MVVADPFLHAADLFDRLATAGPNQYTPHKPHPPQRAFLDLPNLEALYGGAAGGGKSDALLMAALQYVDVPGYNAIIFRRMSPQLHGSEGLVTRSKDWLGPILGLDAFNESKLRWTFPSGAHLWFGHAQHEDDIQKYQGLAYQFLGFDELTHFTERQYTYLPSRMRKQTTGPISEVPLRIRSASNPGGLGHDWVKRRFIDKLPRPDDSEDTAEKCRARAFIPAKLSDNPSIHQESYLESLSMLEPEERKQLLDGNWEVRGPGDWYFEDLAAVAQLGREFEELLRVGEMPDPSRGILDFGLDWGESSHALLGWPLEGGGFFVAREHVSSGMEPGEKTRHILALRDDVDPKHDWALGRAYFDAAGIQSQRTFNAVRNQLGLSAPSAKSIPFGAPGARTARTAARSIKGVGCSYVRTLARRATMGHLTRILAVSPLCPVLLRQLKPIQSNAEDPAGAWLKDDDQHGPDALVALVATTANWLRAAAETNGNGHHAIGGRHVA